MADNEQNDDNGKKLGAYAKYTGVAFQMAGIIGLFTFAGYKIDQAADHQTKWVTAVLALIGVMISMYIVIKSLKD